MFPLPCLSSPPPKPPSPKKKFSFHWILTFIFVLHSMDAVGVRARARSEKPEIRAMCNGTQSIWTIFNIFLFRSKSIRKTLNFFCVASSWILLAERVYVSFVADSPHISILYRQHSPVSGRLISFHPICETSHTQNEKWTPNRFELKFKQFSVIWRRSKFYTAWHSLSLFAVIQKWIDNGLGDGAVIFRPSFRNACNIW